MENQDRFLRLLHTFLPRHLSEDIDGMRNIDIIGAAGRACLARSTNPDGIAVEDLFQYPKLYGMHNLMGKNVHGKG